MCKKVILVPNLTYSKYYMVVQYNATQELIKTTNLSQQHYGHAVIITEVEGSIPLTNKDFNDQPTMLQVPFGGVS